MCGHHKRKPCKVWGQIADDRDIQTAELDMLAPF